MKCHSCIRRCSFVVICIIFHLRCHGAVDEKELDIQIDKILVEEQYLYLGGVNTIRSLNYDFEEIHNFSTGPSPDNPRCAPIGIPFTDPNQIICKSKNNKNLVSTQNHNKILLLAKTPFPMLVVCGTLFRGLCSFLNATTLERISLIHNNAAIETYNRYSYASANMPDASTVAFITGDKIDVTTLLVTAKTMTYDRPTSLVPQIAILTLGKSLADLDDTFLVANDARVILYSKDRYDAGSSEAQIKVNYVSSFTIGEFGYFLLTQRKKLTDAVSPFVTKIARLKIANSEIVNYVELRLYCKSGSIDYNLLLSSTTVNTSIGYYIFGLFAETKGTTKDPTGKYAVCRFHLETVDERASLSLKSCDKYNNKELKWPDTSNCKNKIIASSMNSSGVVFYETEIKLNTILGHSHRRGVALYISTGDGEIKMFHVREKQGKLFEFNKRSFSGNGDRSFHSMAVGKQSNYIFAVSKSLIVKVLIEDCSKRLTCERCLSGPGCGWCTLEQKCSAKSECKNNDKQYYFIDQLINQCPSISNVSPPTVSVQEKKKVEFETSNIPTDVEYKCSFNGFSVGGSMQDAKFVCDELNFNQVPNRITVEGSSSVNISLRSTEDKFIASILFSVYNCSALNMCKTCVTGRNKCGWCSDSLLCIDNTVKSQTCSSLISYQGENSTKYKDFCPRLVSISNNYFANNVGRNFELTGGKLPRDSGSSKYTCSLTIEEKTQTTTAVWNSTSKITCNAYKFSYSKPYYNYTAKISVAFGNTQIDTSELDAAVLYMCAYNREDCSICLIAPQQLGCVWCTETCSAAVQCEDKKVTSVCPAPVISNVSPLEVPIGGNTTVTINGSDLGLKPSDIISITLAGLPCTQSDSQYQVSRRVVCVTSKATSPVDGDVNLQVNSTNRGNVISTYASKFFYRKPTVVNISPIYGPCAGGTEVLLNGTYLDVGNNVQVFVGDFLCDIKEKERSYIACTTSRATSCNKEQTRKRRRRRQSTASLNKPVEVLIDGVAIDDVQPKEFSYKEDPDINTVYTSKYSIDTQTFESGGQNLFVRGYHLRFVQNPVMIFSDESLNTWKLNSSCKVLPNFEYVCVAPNMTNKTRLRERGLSLVKVALGFRLDGFFKERFRDIEVVPDPIFDLFDGVRVVKSQDLTLTGSGFNVIHKKDVTVTVAGLPCNVTDLDKSVVCKLPSETKILEKSEVAGQAEVVVKVGVGNLTYKLGNIEFYKAMDDETGLIVYVVPTCVGLLILVVIIIIMFVLYRKKHKKDKKYQELTRLRMDRMESQYARECKEAFAEYQTEITDLSHDVDHTVSPYLDFHRYTMRVLYPGVLDHAILEPNNDSRPEWEESMKSLIELLKEKEFVLTFVHTLEGQSSFQMTDRCVVASLIMVSLQSNIRYVTSILRDLLTDLIEKTATGKRPKLLLRRTESVAEKLLTNWLAYTLHGFLQSTVGEPLFKLFSAMNILLEKEPIDAITSDAKNSLSEDKLLRQKVDFKSMSVDVEYITQATTETYENIPVLSCDTISQTKRKIIKYIYKVEPFSALPKIDGLVLGFPSASGALLVLKDEDSTNILEGEWKKINTLDHYKVPDKAKLRLGPVTIICPNEPYAENGGGGVMTPYPASPPRVQKSSLKRRILSHSLRSIQDIGRNDSALLNNMSMPSVAFPQSGVWSTSTPMLHHADVNEPKKWHMVKQTDYPQDQKEELRQSKMMAEVFLTRLLKTKETLQLFVSKLFDSIFGLYEGGRNIPHSVKYLFDFLDEQAKELGIEDDEVKHTWKNNSLPLRFWINMIKNPNFIFDIDKSNTVDSCLSVIAQLFMDSCSPDENRLGKDSPSNKLLYAKEIPEYKKKVKKFYADVAESSFDEEGFFKSLDEISEKYGNSFNSCNAARELMGYAVKYKVKLMDTLEQSGLEEFAERLQTIMENMPDD